MKSKYNYFGFNFAIIKSAGLWVSDPTEPFHVRCLYWIYKVTLLGFSMVLICPSELYALSKTYNMLELFMKNLSIGGMHALGVVKSCIWLWKRKEILHMIKTLEEKAAEYEAIDDFQPEKIIKDEKKIKNILNATFLIFGCNVGLTSAIGAILALILDYQKYEKTVVNFDNTTSYSYTQPVPYLMFMPFIYDTSKKIFGVAIFYTCFPIFHFALIIIGIDTLVTSLLSYISIHMKLVCGGFTTIRRTCLRELQLPDEPVFHNAEELEIAMKNRMKYCVKHLQMLFKMCEKLEDIYTYLILIQVLCSQIIICACLYMVSAIPITSKAFATELVYLVAVEIQIALYCFYGNKVTTHSDEINLALYSGDWLSASTSFKTNMLITMIRMRQPVFFTIGKISPLTLTTFLSIGRASYSFFAVIKKQNA